MTAREADTDRSYHWLDPLGEAERIGRDWLPAGDAALRRYYYRNVFPAHSMRKRVAAALNRRGYRASCHDPDASGLSASLASFTTRARELTNGEGPAQTGRWVLLNGHGNEGNAVILLFAEAAARPRVVVKVAKTASRQLERERVALSRIRPRLPAGFRSTLPEPLALLEHGSWSGLVLSALPGAPVYKELVSSWWPGRQVRRHFAAAARWLGEFHRATSATLPDEAAERTEEDLAEDLGHLDADREKVSEWAKEFLDLWRSSRPAATAVHGDFWSRNLLIRHGDWAPSGVVDWADAKESGDLCRDLFHFPLSYGLSFPWNRRRRATPGEAFRRAFLETNSVSQAVRGYFESYCRVTGLDQRLLEPLMILYLLRKSLLKGSSDRIGLPVAGLPEKDRKGFASMLLWNRESVFSG